MRDRCGGSIRVHLIYVVTEIKESWLDWLSVASVCEE